jgi:hypothetical protein
MIELKYVITGFVIFVLFCYIKYYTKTYPTLTFLQSTIDKVDFDMLNGKIPIIITDQIVDVRDVFSSVFNYQHTFVAQMKTTFAWVRNSNKYMVVYPTERETIKIAHPKSKMRDGKYEYIDIIMNKNQLLILPYGWWILSNKCNVFRLDDFFSKLVSFVL